MKTITGTIKKRKGVEYIKLFDGKDEWIVGMITFGGKIVIATNKAIYRYPPKKKRRKK